MAWNGSSSNANAKPVTAKSARVPKKSSSILHGLLAGGIVVLIGIVALFFLKSEQDEPETKPKSPTTIAEATPDLDATPAPAPVVKPKPIDPNARPTKVGEEVNGYVLLPSGRMHYRTGVITNSIAMRPKGRWEIFDRACNNDIAAYLTLEPGGLVIGPMRYDGWFKKDFLESLEEPIIVGEKDTPDEKALKKMVIAARQELKDAMDRGEDIEQIMRDTRADLQRMMEVKMEMRNLFFEEKQNCEADQDLDDLFNACNKMLEDKGIAPLKYGPITRRNLEWQNNHENN